MRAVLGMAEQEQGMVIVVHKTGLGDGTGTETGVGTETGTGTLAGGRNALEVSVAVVEKFVESGG